MHHESIRAAANAVWDAMAAVEKLARECNPPKGVGEQALYSLAVAQISALRPVLHTLCGLSTASKPDKDQAGS